MKLPDIRQQSGYDCGLAACRIVSRLFRRRWGPDLTARLGTSPMDGTDPRAIESTLRHVGWGVIAGEMTIDDLRHHTALERPVICLITRGGIGHYVVVGGIDCGRIHVQCPADGPIITSSSKFIAAWQDVDRLGAIYHQFALAVWKRPQPRPAAIDHAEVERINSRLRELLP
jgi:ABC-type bacteriocin/lantibiotic exporter with double-glycine peptidase domain